MKVLREEKKRQIEKQLKAIGFRSKGEEFWYNKRELEDIIDLGRRFRFVPLHALEESTDPKTGLTCYEVLKLVAEIDRILGTKNVVDEEGILNVYYVK